MDISLSEDKTLEFDITEQACSPIAQLKSLGYIRSISIHPTKPLYIASTWDNTLKFHEKLEIDYPLNKGDYIKSLQWSPNGNNCFIHIYNKDYSESYLNYSLKDKLITKLPLEFMRRNRTECVKFSSTGKELISSCGLFNLRTEKYYDSPGRIQYCSQGNRLLKHENNVCTVFDQAQDKDVYIEKNSFAEYTLSPDGTMLVKIILERENLDIQKDQDDLQYYNSLLLGGRPFYKIELIDIDSEKSYSLGSLNLWLDNVCSVFSLNNKYLCITGDCCFYTQKISIFYDIQCKKNDEKNLLFTLEGSERIDFCLGGDYFLIETSSQNPLYAIRQAVIKIQDVLDMEKNKHTIFDPSNGTRLIWRLYTAKEALRLPGNEKNPAFCFFSPNNKHILYLLDGIAKVIHIDLKKSILCLNNVAEPCAFNGSGTMLFLTDKDSDKQNRTGRIIAL
jgi:WD40 repeat protein